MTKTILFLFGTRPEAIKFAPLIVLFRKKKHFRVQVCVTGQHREMLKQVIDFFDLEPDQDLRVMQPNQDLAELTAGILLQTSKLLDKYRPDLVFVQGDTTTVFAGAVAASYRKIKVAHLEAGLRTYDKHAPFPEEMNRCLVSKLADYHFAPTQGAKDNLKKEGIHRNVWLTGNTVVDALLLTDRLLKRKEWSARLKKKFSFIDRAGKILLVTCHRREIFGVEFENICKALRKLATSRADVHIVYPVHLNPNISGKAKALLGDIPNIHLMEPLSYPELVWILKRSYLVLTDSGGIQEEAPSFGKPVLVLRNKTERTEGIRSGNAILVGTNSERIVRQTIKLLDSDQHYLKMARAKNPYGSGDASEKIHRILKANL
jgi:UDP-N-acetylglucosamine 2-epimerase (non-hydrolysing)